MRQREVPGPGQEGTPRMFGDGIKAETWSELPPHERMGFVFHAVQAHMHEGEFIADRGTIDGNKQRLLDILEEDNRIDVPTGEFSRIFDAVGKMLPPILEDIGKQNGSPRGVAAQPKNIGAVMKELEMEDGTGENEEMRNLFVTTHNAVTALRMGLKSKFDEGLSLMSQTIKRAKPGR